MAFSKLISMFNPAGAIIQAAMAIYNTVMFFVERGSQIAALAEAVFSSIGNIAKGNVAGAANYVEQTMGRSLPVTIGFLARLIGLSGVSEQIKNVIKKIQDKVENALNKLANFIVEKGKSLLAGGGGKNKPDTSTQGNNNGRSSNGEVKLEKAFTMVSEAHRNCSPQLRCSIANGATNGDGKICAFCRNGKFPKLKMQAATENSYRHKPTIKFN